MSVIGAELKGSWALLGAYNELETVTKKIGELDPEGEIHESLLLVLTAFRKQHGIEIIKYVDENKEATAVQIH